MKTLKEFTTVVDAGLVRAELGAAGIESWILDEASATIGYGSGVLGVRLAVEDEDVEEAQKLLAGIEASRD